jgi:hypothetical protein
MFEHSRRDILAVSWIGVGTFGAAVDALEEAYPVAKLTADAGFIAEVGGDLSEAFNMTGRHAEALAIAEQVAALEGLTGRAAIKARFNKASRLAEARRPLEALTLQRELLEESTSGMNAT